MAATKEKNALKDVSNDAETIYIQNLPLSPAPAPDTIVSNSDKIVVEQSILRFLGQIISSTLGTSAPTIGMTRISWTCVSFLFS